MRKSLDPVFRSGKAASGMSVEFLAEISQLCFFRLPVRTGQLKIESAVEKLVDQIGLSYPSAPLNYYQLSLIRFHAFF